MNREISLPDSNIEHQFLSGVIDSDVPVVIFLINGVKLQGSITGFGNDVCLLSRNDVTQLVYRHAISTIMPAGKPKTIHND